MCNKNVVHLYHRIVQVTVIQRGWQARCRYYTIPPPPPNSRARDKRYIISGKSRRPYRQGSGMPAKQERTKMCFWLREMRRRTIVGAHNCSRRPSSMRYAPVQGTVTTVVVQQRAAVCLNTWRCHRCCCCCCSYKLDRHSG